MKHSQRGKTPETDRDQYERAQREAERKQQAYIIKQRIGTSRARRKSNPVSLAPIRLED